MRIKNRNLAGHDLNIPGIGLKRGDADGQFDVPDEYGAKLCRTPGWTAVAAAGEAPPVAAPLPALVPVGAFTQADGPHLDALPPAAPEEAGEPGDASEGPDLTGLDKAGLLKVAEEYGVEIDARWGEKRLRDAIEAALYGDSSEDAPEDGAEGE